VQIDTNRAPRACAARMASSTADETAVSTSSYPGMITVSARLSPSRPAGVLTVNPEPGSDVDPTFSADGQAVVRVATEDLRRDPELQRDHGR